MPRKSAPSTLPVAAVRRYFGLPQETLAAYLGVSSAQIGHLEAGRRLPTAATLQRLQPLLQVLPALTAPGPPPNPAAHLAAPEAAPLQARLAYCRHHAERLRRELAAFTSRLEAARRWQAVLPALLAEADEKARRWLLRRQEQAAADLDATTAAEYHLLRLRLTALEDEATALLKLLP